MKKILSFIFVWFIVTSSSLALTVDNPMQNAAQETRARALFHELRCVVCQGETIADSPSDVARDMRKMVRARIALGEDDAAVIDYFVSQYGEKVLMLPPVKNNVMLWVAPLIVLFIGAYFAWRKLFRRRR